MSDSNPNQGSHDEYGQQYQDYYSNQQGSSYYDQEQSYGDKGSYQESRGRSSRDYDRKDSSYQRSGRYEGSGSSSNRYSQESNSRHSQNDSRGRFDSGNGIHKMEDTIYISNLPQEVTEENLASHFGSIGIIKTDKKLRKPKIWIYMDKATNLPKGDATITYDDPPSADAAIDWFGGKEFLGNVIQVTKAERKMNIAERGRGGRGAGGGSGRSYGSSGRSERTTSTNSAREGDWSCEECGANNFSRRDECYTCHKPRSGGGSSGAKRYDDKRSDSYKNNRSYRRDRPY